MTDYLIAGGGPSGLTAAIELYRRGMPVRIIDKAADFAEQSRAIGINPRTLAILSPSGATERLLAEGTRIERSVIHFPNGRNARLDFSRIDSAFPFMLALPQSRTERLLNEVLTEHGGQVEHKTSLEGLVQDEEAVRCRIDGPRGLTEVTAAHLIGADGAYSRVREQAGIAFPGDELDHDWNIADVVMDWPYPPNELHIFLDWIGFALAITIGQGRFRLVSSDGSPEARLPKGTVIKQEIWRSAFRVQHRQVPTYQQGRVYLAGDAAHVHSPLGARGMNMGVADASTLAWLLSESREADYTAIRHPVGARTIAMVKRQTMQVVLRDRLQRQIAGWMAPIILSLPPVHRFATSIVTGLADPEPVWLQGVSNQSH
jgi:2-polyprenyl-6-methoxyphenol hydroxylase-like FAD-dependent oxidoreductase